MTIFDTYHKPTNTYQFYDEPIVLQSDYFNVAFQKAIEDLGGKINVKKLLMITAQEIVYTQFSTYFKEQNKMSLQERKDFVVDYYAHCGFGTLSVKGISNKGGYADVQTDHFAIAWKKIYGTKRETDNGVGYFTCGFLCGAVEAMFDVKLGSFDGKQSKCQTKGDGISRFNLFRGLKKPLRHSPKLGAMQSSVDRLSEDGDSTVINFIRKINPTGLSSENGIINAFDTTWTKQYANYSSMIIFKLLSMGKKELGENSMQRVKKMLYQLGESKAYYLLGKIYNSTSWKEYMTNELTLQTALDIMTALGYGKWILQDIDQQSCEVVIQNNPQTNAFLKLVGNTKVQLGFLTGGFLTGLVNFIKYKPKSMSINQSYIDYLKSKKGNLIYKELDSRMLGSEVEKYAIG